MVTQTREGGLARIADPFVTLNRYLVMGIQDSFYETENEAFVKFTNLLVDCLAIDPDAVVAAIVDARRTAPKPNAAIIAMAIACSGEFQDRAWPRLSEVVWTSSHLILFVAVMEQLRGWGRRPRRLLGQWMQSKPALDRLKYQSRTWLGKTVNQRHLAERIGRHYYGNDELYYWAIRGEMPTSDSRDAQIIRAVKSLPDLSDEDFLRVISEYRLPWEVTPTNRRNKAMWETVLPHIGPTALLRNMGVMAAQKVDFEMIIGALETVREHPMNILVAWYMYKQGHGMRGTTSWVPNYRVVDALERAYYRGFSEVPFSNSKSLVVVDASGSMSAGGLAGIRSLSPRVVAATFALIAARTQPDAEILAFATRSTPLHLDSTDTLEAVTDKIQMLDIGHGTHTELAMQAAHDLGDRDSVVLYSDMQTMDRNTERLLRSYRAKHPLKYVEVAMVPNDLTFAHSENDLTLQGFSTDIPQTINSFITL